MVVTLCESFLELINIHARLGPLGIEMPLFFVAHSRRSVRLVRTRQTMLHVPDKTSDTVRFGGV